MSSELVLQAENINKAFGGLRALNGISVNVGKGEAVGLIGPNGSGKTTFINVVTGLITPDSGTIRLGGVDIASTPVHRRVGMGLNRTYQIPASFKKLSVVENVLVAERFGAKRKRSNTAAVDEVLEKVQLGDLRHRLAGTLNSTQQKLLDIARALITEPKLLLVDELAAGLTPNEVNRLVGLLTELRKSGISLVVVEHIMSFVRQITDRVVVMDTGKIIFEGHVDAAMNDDNVVEVFLGTKTGAGQDDD